MRWLCISWLFASIMTTGAEYSVAVQLVCIQVTSTNTQAFLGAFRFPQESNNRAGDKAIARLIVSSGLCLLLIEIEAGFHPPAFRSADSMRRQCVRVAARRLAVLPVPFDARRWTHECGNNRRVHPILARHQERLQRF